MFSENVESRYNQPRLPFSVRMVPPLAMDSLVSKKKTRLG